MDNSLPTDIDRRSRLTSVFSFSSSSLASSTSSFASAMCASSIDSNNNQSIQKGSATNHTFQNKAVCKICNQMKLINGFHTCIECCQEELSRKSNSTQCSSKDQKSSKHFIRSHSFHFGKTSSKYENISIENKNKDKKKFSCQLFKNLLRLHGHHHQSKTDVSSQSSLYRLVLRPQLSIEIIETSSTTTTTTPTPTPTPPLSRRDSPTSVSSLSSNSPPPLIRLSPEDIKECQQRQKELDRVIQNLIESIKRKMNENIAEIPRYWPYLKQLFLNKLQPKSNQSHVFNYLSRTSSTKRMETYLEQNEHIQARFDILSTVLTALEDKYTISRLDEIFNIEERSMKEHLHSELEFLVSSYSDELSFIHGRLHFYKSNPSEEKSFDWIQILRGDYPYLIEKLSNDYTMKVPSIDQILIDMLGNMKKRLLGLK